MKTKIIDCTEKAFTPIKVKITFESKEEVIDFYARMNVSAVSVQGSIPKGEEYKDCCWKLWNVAKECYSRCQY